MLLRNWPVGHKYVPGRSVFVDTFLWSLHWGGKWWRVSAVSISKLCKYSDKLGVQSKLDGLRCLFALYMWVNCPSFIWMQPGAMKLTSQRQIPAHGASEADGQNRVKDSGQQIWSAGSVMSSACLHKYIFSLSSRQQKHWILSHCYENRSPQETREGDKVVQNSAACQQNWEWQPSCDICSFYTFHSLIHSGKKTVLRDLPLTQFSLLDLTLSTTMCTV